MTKIVYRFLPPLLLFFFFALTFEMAVQTGFISSFILPAPSDVGRALRDEFGVLLEATTSTAFCAGIGLLLSIVIGVGLAITLSLFTLVKRALYPYAIFFQTVPIISIAPLLVIWFGFGEPTVIASAFIVSIFPVIASTLLGLESTDKALLDLFKLYSASKKDFFLRLRIPFALPHIFNGLRIAAGLAVIGAIVGEFIAGGGLGSIVDVARTQQRIDMVFACVLMSTGLGVVLISLIDFARWLSLRHWHVSERRVE